MTRPFALLIALCFGAATLAAQATPAPPPAAPPAPAAAPAPDVDSAGGDTLFLRAQKMAAEGQGDAARALVQHELDAAAAGSPRYVDALYWRAVVASTAADAERDLRRIIIEFPLSARNEDALLRLAQLEMTRGDNDQALTHLQRLVLDHPESPSRARASFWMARVYFDKNQTTPACRSLADAARHTAAGQVEQRNQIDFWMQRCQGVDTSAVAAASASRDSAPAPAPSSQPTVAAAPPPAPTSPPAPAPSAVSSSRPRAPASTGRAQYTVQVAAYATRDQAEALRKSLAARGVTARIVGATKPYRVRVGRFGSRTEAEAVAKSLKAKDITVYVTEAEPR
jgi:cell division protein FtsN